MYFSLNGDFMDINSVLLSSSYRAVCSRAIREGAVSIFVAGRVPFLKSPERHIHFAIFLLLLQELLNIHLSIFQVQLVAWLTDHVLNSH